MVIPDGRWNLAMLGSKATETERPTLELGDSRCSKANTNFHGRNSASMNKTKTIAASQRLDTVFRRRYWTPKIALAPNRSTRDLVESVTHCAPVPPAGSRYQLLPYTALASI